MSYRINGKELVEASYLATNLYTQQMPEDPEMPASLSIYLPPTFGAGAMRVYQRNDMTVLLSDMCFQRNIKIIESAHTENFFTVTAVTSAVLHIENTIGQCEAFSAGVVSLAKSHADTKHTLMVGASERVQAVSFYLDQDIIIGYLLEFGRTDIVNRIQRKDIFPCISSALTVEQLQCIQCLRNNPYKGCLGELYFDAMASKLLLMLLQSLLSTSNSLPAGISKRDQDCLRQAREELLSDLRNPPSIEELAGRVGVNQDKLKKGFKLLFSNTVFQTLREHRMQVAMELLRSEKMTVTEAAHHVGYSNVSHFISAFKKHFDITPGSLRI